MQFPEVCSFFVKRRCNISFIFCNIFKTLIEVFHLHLNSCVLVQTTKKPVLFSLAWNQSKYVFLFSFTYWMRNQQLIYGVANSKHSWGDNCTISPQHFSNYFYLNQQLWKTLKWRASSSHVPLFVMIGLIVGIEHEEVRGCPRWKMTEALTSCTQGIEHSDNNCEQEAWLKQSETSLIPLQQETTCNHHTDKKGILNCLKTLYSS